MSRGFLQELSELCPHAVETLVVNELWGPEQGWNSPVLPLTQRGALGHSGLESEVPRMEESQHAFLQTAVSLAWLPNQEVDLESSTQTQGPGENPKNGAVTR